jgi:hypothetical protein
MDSDNKHGYLARYGEKLIEAGYRIVPLKVGEKFPPFDGWEQVRPDIDELRGWLANGVDFVHKKTGEDRNVKVTKAGIGIIAANTPGVDLDIRDKEVALHMEQWVHDNVAMAPVRVGMAPKRLLMFRTDAPFRKMNSAIFEDEFGDKHQIEILGDGQQFVAMHIHPETGKPYEWLYNDGPLITPHDELPILTADAARRIIAEFEKVGKENGWKVKKKSANMLTTTAPAEIDMDDPFIADSQKTDIDEEELHAKLLLVPPADDYETWMNVGMALYHQFDGGERGLELWHEWAQNSAEYDADEIDDKWENGGLDVTGKDRMPMTARYILKLAKEAAETAATETLDQVCEALRAAKTVQELNKAAAQVKKTQLDAPSREQVVGLLKDCFKILTGQNLGVKTARDMVRFENPKTKELPRWLKGWVYLSDEDRFYSTASRSMMTQTAFNSSYSRFMLTKQDVLEGRPVPERLPAHVALNVYQVPVVAGRRYMPGGDELFTINGVEYANLYTEAGIPEVPEEHSKRDRRNLAIVQAHFAHLFKIERDRELFKDWLAYIVQNPGKRPNWAVLMQGTEKDGKTFFGVMMGAVLGEQNLAIVDPKSLEESFNAFAEGHQLAFIEEVKLHGHNRYDVLNRIKPLITNSAITIRRMRTDSYKVPNMTAYLLATNFRDALPISDSDSRYFILFSHYQTKFALEQFIKCNPGYYDNLYRAIEESPGAIRGWLMNREFGADFNPNARAPASTAHRYMVMMTKSEDQEAVEELLAESMRWDMCRELLSATDLLEQMVSNGEDLDTLPKTRKISKLLSDMGFTFLGRVKIDGRPRRYWSQTPERFIIDGELDTQKVRDWVEMTL